VTGSRFDVSMGRPPELPVDPCIGCLWDRKGYWWVNSWSN